MPEKVKITHNEYVVTDEIYTTFYSCPNCENDDIQRGFKYCPSCGKEIEWDMN